MTRTLFLALILATTACDAPQGPLRQVSIESPAALGLSLQEVPAQALSMLGLSYGLAVVRAGTMAQSAGLQVGDVVYAVNQRRLRTIEDFARIVAEQPGGRLGLQVRRGKADFYVPVDLGAGTGRAPRDTLLRT